MYYPQKSLQRMTDNVGSTFSVGDSVPWLQLALSKTIRIGDTKYHV